MKLSEIVQQGHDAELYGIRTNAGTWGSADYLDSIAEDPEQFDVEVSALTNGDSSISVYRLDENGYAESTEWVRLVREDEE
jgi:hypothetical protein